MKALASAVLFVVVAMAAAVVGVVVWLALEIGNRAINALDGLGPGIFTAGALVTFGAFVFVVAGGSVAIVRWMALRSRMIQHRDGLYPQMYHSGEYRDVNAPHAQALAVMHQHRGARAGAASVGRVLDWQAPDLPQIAEPAQVLTVQDVVDVDPRTAPHWLLIGSTGSGKTIASYAVLGELARRAACQFVITEPGGVNWGAQTTATNTADIARAILDVQAELERRQALLRAEDVDHVQDLREPLPYLVLVAEETETVLDDLRLVDKDTRTACVIALRSIARLGRKCGICLVAVTQSGTTDVFDSHVRKNMSNVLLFRSQHTTGETWRVSRDVQLAQLPTGAAWSVMHNAVVQFPRVQRPTLPTVQRLELPEPVLADDGIAIENWPTAQRFSAVLGGSGGFWPGSRSQRRTGPGSSGYDAHVVCFWRLKERDLSAVVAGEERRNLEYP